MMQASDYDSFTQTRFKGLGIARHGAAHWFFVDTSDSQFGAPKIGISYKTKLECLADAHRFASERGFRA